MTRHLLRDDDLSPAEQVEILGREVVPVLRREFEARRPEGVPSEPPTHASLVAEGPDSPHRKVVTSPVAIAEQEAAAQREEVTTR